MNKNQEDIACYFYKEKGHFKLKCPKYKRYLKEKKEKGKEKKKEGLVNKQQANLVEALEKNDFLFLISRFNQGWIVDSDAASHVTPNQDMLVEFNKNHQEKIFVINGQRVAIEGIGMVYIHIINENGNRHLIKIQNVLYVPSINGNLLSVHKLVANELNVNFIPQ